MERCGNLLIQENAETIGNGIRNLRVGEHKFGTLAYEGAHPSHDILLETQQVIPHLAVQFGHFVI